MEKYDFGNRLYEYRTQKGLTQKELGKLLGVTDKAVSKWETGESKPRLDKMNQITELFETSIDGMLGKETAEDGEQLRPYKTIFDFRLEKFGKNYKIARIWSYIFAIICVAVSTVKNVVAILDGGLVTEKIGSFILTIILTAAAVIFTSNFKPKFNECKSKDMNIFMGFVLALFLLISASPVISAVKVGKATGEYDSFTIGYFCFEALILTVIALISFRKKRYTVFAVAVFAFSVSDFIYYDTFYLVICLISAQFIVFIEKRDWLNLVYKADIELKKTSEGQKAAHIFAAVIAIITVISVILSSFSPYIIYRYFLNEYYKEYSNNEFLDYDYSAEFGEEFTEIEFKGAKLKLPKGYEKTSDDDYIVSYKKPKTNSFITITYYSIEDMEETKFDETEIEGLDPDEAEEVRELHAAAKVMDSISQKYYGVSMSSYYGAKYLAYCADMEDVKFYESQKAVLLCGVLIMKTVTNAKSAISVSEFNNGMYCGFTQGRYLTPLSDGKKQSVFWNADVWYSNNTEGAYYSITYCEQGNSDRTDNQTICKIVNSLEF